MSDTFAKDTSNRTAVEWAQGLLILLLLVMLFTTSGYVKPGTVACAFCGGWIILSLGMSIVIKSNSGTLMLQNTVFTPAQLPPCCHNQLYFPSKTSYTGNDFQAHSTAFTRKE